MARDSLSDPNVYLLTIINATGGYVALFVGARAANINAAIAGFSLGAGAVFFSFASPWVVTIDITREYAGTVCGIINFNFVGNFGGMISPIMMPLLVRSLGWGNPHEPSLR